MLAPVHQDGDGGERMGSYYSIGNQRTRFHHGIYYHDTTNIRYVEGIFLANHYLSILFSLFVPDPNVAAPMPLKFSIALSSKYRYEDHYFLKK